MLSWEFPPKVVGGLGRHVYDLSTALARQDVSITVITTDMGDGSPSTERISGVDVHRIQPYPLAASSFPMWVMQMNMAKLEKAVSLFNEEPFDIIHAHDWLSAYCGRALKHTYKVPLISTIHATEFGRHNGLHTDEQRYISDVEWWLTFESWRVICCSNYMLGELQRLFQLPADKLNVLFNGVHPEVFQTDKLNKEVRNRYAAPEEKIIFYIGRLVPEKGVQVLLDAAPSILSRHPEAKFIIAGQGPFKGELEKQVNSLGIQHKVYFTGFIDDHVRNQLYRSASCAVFPSFYEPFGIVALEAMAAGTPVIVADTGGLGENINHDINGLKCSSGDSGSLAEQVIRILKNPKLASSLQEKGKSSVFEKYTWAEIARGTQKVYREVLEEYEASDWKSPRFHTDLPQINAMSLQMTKPGRYHTVQ